MSDTAAAGPVAVVLLVVVAVLLATVTGGLLAGASPSGDPRVTAVGVSATDQTVRLTHRGGPPLDVRDLRLVVWVAGTRLADQPPVPFFAAEGFRGGPTGPFNTAADPRWHVGERASLRVAGSNEPTPTPGDRLRVVVYRDGRRVASAATVVKTTDREPTGTVSERQPRGQSAAASPAVSLAAVGSSSAGGTCATVVIARGLPGFACWTWCSTSTKPAASNISSASSVS